MIISLKWLKEYIDFGYTPEELDSILTMLGIEVESISYPARQYDGFFVGIVLEKGMHPDADKLSVCKVDYGNGETTVICGAPNVAKGQKVAVATIGAIVPKFGFAIEKRKIRGILSEGMICSQSELLLGEDSDGIWVLPDDAPIGLPLAQWLHLDDVLMEISLTPNRADCLSHIGIAREIAAYSGTKVLKPSINLLETGEDIKQSISISIEDIEKCPRYSARVISNVTITESPDWLKNKLKTVGMRPLNLAVDVTNFVLMECGQPLHAFDLEKIAGNKIIVKTANDGDKFTTLDSKERTLDSEMLMICDAERPVAIGGVLGGENSEITNNTTRILLESAYFLPKSVRRTAKKLGIASEASHRFERGVDHGNTIWALDRAAALIAELSGGKVEKGRIDVYPQAIISPLITLRFDKAKKIIGAFIDNNEMADILKQLEFTIINSEEEKLTVQPPTWRVDMEGEIDLIEEIARMYNYDNIQPKYSSIVDYNSKRITKMLAVPHLRDKLRRYFIYRGFAETLNQNMISPKLARIFTEEPIEIANPLGEEISVMRPNLSPSMLKTVQWNLRFGNKNIRLIEIGKVFQKSSNNESVFVPGIVEKTKMMVCISGQIAPLHWLPNKHAVGFFDIKGLLEELIFFFRIPDITFGTINKDNPVFSNNSMTVLNDNRIIGYFGEVKSEFLKIFDIEQAVFLLELDLSELNNTEIPYPKYILVPPYPGIMRDLAFVLPSEVSAGNIVKTIKNNGGDYLQTVDIFDVYEGKSIDKGKKNIAFSLTFSSPEKTLTDNDVDNAIDNIVNSVETRFKAQLRKF